jgi:alpha-tubulin suppressor-like RCC1 family protein
VVAWGDNTSGQTSVPFGLSDVVAIDAGTSHSLALKSDGTVIAWGSNDHGESFVPTGLFGVKAISGGDAFSIALTANGSVAGWGENSLGQASAPAGTARVTAISAGYSHTAAVQAPSPGARVEQLRSAVLAAQLAYGLKTSLVAKLDAAIASLNAHTNGACGQLAAFAHEVEARSGEAIAPAVAAEWIDFAEDMQSALGCFARRFLRR